MKKWNIRTVRRHVSNLLCNLARAGTFNRVPDLLLSDLSWLYLKTPENYEKWIWPVGTAGFWRWSILLCGYPGFAFLVNGSHYQSPVSMPVLIILFLIWGFLMYRLWTWMESGTKKESVRS